MVDTQMWIGEQNPNKGRFESVRNSDDPIHKPKGGLWTSTVREDGTSDWLDWVHTESFYNPDQEVWTLTVRDDVDVVRIESKHGLEAVIEKYDRRDRDNPPDIVRVSSTFAPIDFEAMAENHDALHLTEEGQWNTRMTRPGLYGWDSETYFWFAWRFTQMEYQGNIEDYIDIHYD